MRRPLPTPEEAREILLRRRTRAVRGPPPGAGKALAKTLKALDARFATGAEGLKGRWREIVGEQLARRSEPVRLVKPRDGGPASLEVRVDGPSATLIQHQAGELIARVNMFLGADAVGRLRVVQGPLRGTASRPARAKAGRTAPRLDAPLDAGAEQALQEGLLGVKSEALRESLTRLGRALLRRPTGR